MRIRYGKASLVAAVLLAIGTNAHAMTLWDQSTISPAGPGIAASNSSGFGGLFVHSVDDVTVPASGWVVTKITQYYSAFEPNWAGGVTQGFINIQPKTGPLPTSNPVTVQSPMSCAIDAAQSAAVGQTVLAVTATVNISLPAGDYWIGLTPTKGATINGVNLMWPSAQVGNPVASFQSTVGPWKNNYPGWDGAFKVEGDLPVPAQNSTWGNLKAHYH
ncbi:MAG TPA: hypothetical protein VGR66_03755 [Candidatus Eisenbacteria bacterium]|jgi:hypothetical protein|nr:hypothetical protein [Candidatus Eisenbacteria bacterium]